MSSDTETMASYEDTNDLTGNVHARENSGDEDENGSNRHARIVLEPFDSQLTNNPVFGNARFKEVSLAHNENTSSNKDFPAKVIRKRQHKKFIIHRTKSFESQLQTIYNLTS